MRSSIVLFALCAALVGTHALPAPGYAPSSLVHLNRRAPVDHTPPVNTGPQTVTITVPNPDANRSPASTPRQQGTGGPPGSTGGSQPASTTPRSRPAALPQKSVYFPSSYDVTESKNYQLSSNYQSGASATYKPGSSSPYPPSSGTTGITESKDYQFSTNYRSGAGATYKPGSNSPYPPSSGTTGTTGTTGTASGAIPPGSARTSGDTPTQSYVYLDTFDSPKPLPTPAELQAAGLGDKIEGNGIEGIGDYVKVRFLGEGSFSQVFLMYKAKQFYALKLQGEQFSYRPEEYTIQKALTGKPLVNAVQVGEEVKDGGRRGFFMEPANGGDVHKLIKDSGTGLKESVAKEIIEQLAKGLVEIHKLDYVIRDIKPANVLIFKGAGAAKPVYKFADFGMAAKEGQQYPSFFQWRTQFDPPEKTTLYGDRHYRAPEVNGDTKLFKPVDVYALGCTLYELLSKPGARFVRYNALGDFIGYGDLAVIKQVSTAAAGLIEEMTATKPEDRPTAVTLVEKLKTWVPKS